MREREGLIRRIRQIRRTAEASAPSLRSAAPKSDPVALDSLQTRVELLEGQLEALQDSVHRESERQSKRIAELEAQIQPGALSVALSKDARDRGL
jgi:hypothetical protein